jgi:hypothetical protein
LPAHEEAVRFEEILERDDIVTAHALREGTGEGGSLGASWDCEGNQ